MFWLSTPFLVSEREPHCVMERGLRFTKALRDTLEPRGWIEVSTETVLIVGMAARSWTVNL